MPDETEKPKKYPDHVRIIAQAMAGAEALGLMRIMAKGAENHDILDAAASVGTMTWIWHAEAAEALWKLVDPFGSAPSPAERAQIAWMVARGFMVKRTNDTDMMDPEIQDYHAARGLAVAIQHNLESSRADDLIAVINVPRAIAEAGFMERLENLIQLSRSRPGGQIELNFVEADPRWSIAPAPSPMDDELKQ